MVKEDSDSRLARITQQARSIQETLSPSDASRLAVSPKHDDRLLALARMRVAIERGVPSRLFFDVARELVEDVDNDCRWQAMIVVGESISDQPERVWEVIERHGSADDPDLRDAVATVLLEHILEREFEQFYPRVAKRILEGDARFADTLRLCWVSAPNSAMRARLDHLLTASERGMRTVE